MWNLKNKLVNITKKKHTHRYREQTSDYQSGEGQGEGQDRVGEQEVQTTVYEINKLQGYIIQHREYNQYLIITVNGI